MRIAYVSQYFPPEPAAPAARASELGRAWARAGHAVSVITGFPNHPTGIVPTEYRGRVLATEQYDGLRVLRCWLAARPNRGVGPRATSHLSFMLSALLVGAPRMGGVDVVVASSPPLFTALAGLAIARLQRVPFVMDVRDLWPDAFAEVGVMRAGAATRALARLARALYLRAARVVVVTERFGERLVRQGVAPSRLAVVPNGADLEVFGSVPDGASARERLGIARDAFVAAYVGSHGRSQGLEVLLDAAARDTGTVYVLVGDGAEREGLLSAAGERGLSNVRMFPSVPREEVPALYAAADVCLVSLRPLPIFETFVPSKLFEMLAAGRPVVGALAGEAREILERSRGGVAVPPGDGAAVAAAVENLRARPTLRSEMGERGRTFVREHFDRERLAARYLAVLQSAVAA